MLFLLSPAKSLDYDTPVSADVPTTQPVFEGAKGPAAELIALLRRKSPQQIAELMSLSDKLSALNVARYAGYWQALTRSVGAGPTIEVETRYLTPRSGDVLLLCSDGLTNAIDDEVIAQVLTSTRDLHGAAAELIARANDNGGPDNVTVALQRWI